MKVNKQSIHLYVRLYVSPNLTQFNMYMNMHTILPHALLFHRHPIIYDCALKKIHLICASWSPCVFYSHFYKHNIDWLIMELDDDVIACGRWQLGCLLDG